MPEAGSSIDRRALQNVVDAISEETISCLMCFIRSCKHFRVSGYDAFGEPRDLGKIRYLEPDHYLVKELVNGSKNNVAQVARDQNISEDLFQRRFGDALAKDPTWVQDNFEWRRVVSQATFKEVLLCCPEDVRQTQTCKHSDHMVCTSCQIPVCLECSSSIGE